MANEELVVALKLVADQFKSGLAAADSSLGQFANAVTRMATDWKTASALIATSLTAITQAAGKHAEQLTHLSQETGDSTQKLQEMDVLLNRTGVSAEAFARSMKTVAERLAEAKAGTGVGSQLFQALGFTPEQIQAMETADDALRAIADRLTNYRDGLAKTDLVAQVFGRQFIAMLPAISGGAAAFDAAAKKAYELGGVLGDQTIKQLAATDDAIDDLQIALTAFRDQVGAVFGPAIKWLTELLTDFVAGLTSAVQWVRYLGGALGILFGAALDAAIANTEGFFATFKLRFLRSITMNPEDVAQLTAQIEQAMAPYRAKVAEIWANADALRSNLADDISGATGKKDTRPPAPAFRDNISERAKALDAQLKQRLQELKEEERAVKNSADLQLAYIKANIESKLTTDKDAALQTQQLDLETWEKLHALLQQEYVALLRFYQDRYKVGFKDKESRIQFEAEWAQKTSQYREKAETAATEFIKKGVADQSAVQTAGFKETVKIREEEVKAAQLVLESRQQIAEKELALLHAKHAEELRNTTATGDEIVAIRARQAAEIKMKQIEAYGSFWDNYLLGLRQFINDNQSGFGLARQMAIDTAKAMSQAFEQFFFNVFTGKIHSMMELLQNFLNSVLQALSAILARMVTTGLLQGGASLFSGFGSPALAQAFQGGEISSAAFRGINNPGLFGPGFAAGGYGDFGSGTQVTLHGKEIITPIEKIGQVFGSGGGDISIVVNNNTGVEAQADARQSRGPDGKVLIELILTKVKGAFNDGSMDSMMGQNYGVLRRGASR